MRMLSLLPPQHLPTGGQLSPAKTHHQPKCQSNNSVANDGGIVENDDLCDTSCTAQQKQSNFGYCDAKSWNCIYEFLDTGHDL